MALVIRKEKGKKSINQYNSFTNEAAFCFSPYYSREKKKNDLKMFLLPVWKHLFLTAKEWRQCLKCLKVSHKLDKTNNFLLMGTDIQRRKSKTIQNPLIFCCFFFFLTPLLESSFYCPISKASHTNKPSINLRSNHQVTEQSTQTQGSHLIRVIDAITLYSGSKTSFYS